MSKDSISGNPFPATSIPGRRPTSRASVTVWLAVASDRETVWAGRKLSAVSDLVENDPICPVYGQAFESAMAPLWVREEAIRIDSFLPDQKTLLDRIDPRDLVLPLDPAIGRIPTRADTASVGLCILASRIALACAPHLVPPALTSYEDAVASLTDASYLAIYAGGADALAAASRLLKSPSFFDKPDTDVDELVFVGKV